MSDHFESLQVESDPQVTQVFEGYPAEVRKKLLSLRRLILETADELEQVSHLEETLKWGEPSYLVRKGSTIRIDWKPRKPDQYAMYFKCTSKLVPTFREVYGDIFRFEGDRAIVFNLTDTRPEEELKRCIVAALTYHTVKKQLLLGM